MIFHGNPVGFSFGVQILKIVAGHYFKTRVGWLVDPFIFLVPGFVVQFMIVASPIFFIKIIRDCFSPNFQDGDRSCYTILVSSVCIYSLVA